MDFDGRCCDAVAKVPSPQNFNAFPAADPVRGGEACGEGFIEGKRIISCEIFGKWRRRRNIWEAGSPRVSPDPDDGSMLHARGLALAHSAILIGTDVGG